MKWRPILATLVMLCLFGGFFAWLHLSGRLTLMEIGVIVFMGTVMVAAVVKLYEKLWDDGEE